MEQKPNRARHATLTIVLTAFALGGGLVWPESQAAAAASPPGPSDVPAGADWNHATQTSAGIPVTASHVHIQARLLGSATTSGPYTLSVHLHIDNGWHVYPNPASLNFLIPTTIAAKAGGHAIRLHTVYPPGVQSNIHLDGVDVKVYDNDATIRSQLSPAAVAAANAAGGLQVTVRAQACTDKICLPPSVMKTHVAGENR